jgi:FkbM family methyltransferase
MHIALSNRLALAASERAGGAWARGARSARLANGVAISVRPWYGVERGIFLYGVHEPMVWDTLCGLIKPGHVVIDVGAHVGQFALLAANLVGTAGKVIAIEPNPEIRPLLHLNIGKNGLANVQVIGAAAVDEPGTLTLYAYKDDRNSGAVSLREFPRARKEYQVAGIRLDDLVAVLRLGKVDLMKIDVEGAEQQVLAGARSLLASSQPDIVVEVTANGHHLELERLLRELGYSFFLPTIGSVKEVIFRPVSDLVDALAGAVQVDVVASVRAIDSSPREQAQHCGI